MASVELKRLQVTRRHSGDYELPYWEVDSGRPGPCVLVTASLHGNELQGAEVLSRFVGTAGDDLQNGSCLLVPFGNPCAIRNRQPHIDTLPGRYYGSDRQNNLNCTWPGLAKGTDAQRLSYALMALVERASHNIDLHCWQGLRATTALPRRGHPPSMEFARVSAVRFVRPGGSPPGVRERPVTPCTLTSYFNDSGRTAVCFELSGQNIFRETEVRRGRRAVVNILKHVDMLTGDPEGLEEEQVVLEEANEHHVKAPVSGVFIKAELATSDPVARGTVLGHILSDIDLGTTEVVSPVAGYLFLLGHFEDPGTTTTPTAMIQHPFTDRGDDLAVVVEA